MMELLGKIVAPLTEILLICALLWVGFLFMKVDQKLTALKRGTDGVAKTMFELNKAVEKAQNAVNDLKETSEGAVAELDAKIKEAKKLSENSRFNSKIAEALQKPRLREPDPNGVEPRGIAPEENRELYNYARRRKNAEDVNKEKALQIEPRKINSKNLDSINQDYRQNDNWGGLR